MNRGGKIANMSYLGGSLATAVAVGMMNAPAESTLSIPALFLTGGIFLMLYGIAWWISCCGGL